MSETPIYDAVAAEQFFYEHAGWSYHPDRETPKEGRQRGAERLALAEAEGKRRGWHVDWEVDQDPTLDDDVDRPEPYDQYVATLRDEDDNLLASLGSVDLGPDEDLTDPYCRVVAAELALDTLTERS